MKGRKRHVIVDTLGLIWAVSVTAASVQDRDGALPLLRKIEHLEDAKHPLQAIYADGSYRGALESLIAALCDWRLVIVEKPPEQIGFAVLPKRWIVERTFAWLSKYRRLAKDHEARPQTSEAMIRWAMINRMSRLLANT